MLVFVVLLSFVYSTRVTAFHDIERLPFICLVKLNANDTFRTCVNGRTDTVFTALPPGVDSNYIHLVRIDFAIPENTLASVYSTYYTISRYESVIAIEISGHTISRNLAKIDITDTVDDQLLQYLAFESDESHRIELFSTAQIEEVNVDNCKGIPVFSLIGQICYRAINFEPKLSHVGGAIVSKKLYAIITGVKEGVRFCWAQVLGNDIYQKLKEYKTRKAPRSNIFGNIIDRIKN